MIFLPIFPSVICNGAARQLGCGLGPSKEATLGPFETSRKYDVAMLPLVYRKSIPALCIFADQSLYEPRTKGLSSKETEMKTVVGDTEQQHLSQKCSQRPYTDLRQLGRIENCLLEGFSSSLKLAPLLELELATGPDSLTSEGTARYYQRSLAS